MTKIKFTPLGACRGFQRLQLVLFTLLSMILLGVFFLLPGRVTVQMAPASTSAESAGEAAKIIAPPDSPWSDAQLAKQRREAQEVLSQILSIQTKLESKKVELWAQDAFSQAMDQAAGGDVQYRERKFSEAQNSYRASLKQFETLIARVDQEYQQQINIGEQAIEGNQPQQAITSYQLASYLKPDSPQAQKGLARAKAQETVIGHIDNGKQLMKRKELRQAKKQFLQALELDPDSKSGKEQLTIVKQAITDDNFGQSMSAGFKALNKQDFIAAISAFTRATKIKPNAADAKEALVQAKNNHTQAQISRHFQQAEQFEQKEQWQPANDYYQKVMGLDKSVIKARVGEIRTAARAKLDTQLQDTITQPERLATPSVYRQGKRFYQDGKGIKNPGPRLTDQLSQLAKLLTGIRIPVAVQLQSDNQTKVTLYKVGELGSFSAKNIDLRPGNYTVVGTRNGYRDIRREFTLLPNSDLTTIVVQCEEKIQL